jgi:hypothetical protein
MCKDLPPGKKLQLQELSIKACTTNWKDLAPEDIDAMVKCLEEQCLLKKTGSCSQPSTHAQDVRQTAKCVQNEVFS